MNAPLEIKVRRRAQRLAAKLLLRYRDQDSPFTPEDVAGLSDLVTGMVLKVVPIYALSVKDPVRTAFRFYEDQIVWRIEAELADRDQAKPH